MNYSKKVMDYFLHPKNMGELEQPDGEARSATLSAGT
jgi:NifU-like protein involved in Fe-S cluster formation